MSQPKHRIADDLLVAQQTYQEAIAKHDADRTELSRRVLQDRKLRRPRWQRGRLRSHGASLPPYILAARGAYPASDGCLGFDPKPPALFAE